MGSPIAEPSSSYSFLLAHSRSRLYMARDFRRAAISSFSGRLAHSSSSSISSRRFRSAATCSSRRAHLSTTWAFTSMSWSFVPLTRWDSSKDSFNFSSSLLHSSNLSTSRFSYSWVTSCPIRFTFSIAKASTSRQERFSPAAGACSTTAAVALTVTSLALAWTSASSSSAETAGPTAGYLSPSVWTVAWVSSLAGSVGACFPPTSTCSSSSS
mmetsp:Transcript_27148/g.81768  ORF Transcript_27148/g.81768 Transcript_27148/m.81768 type:complete len:212 (-) Transcript_27148:273-908(-)